MADQGDWKSEAFRRKVIAQIEEALRNSNTQMNKSSVEMENHVFNKAKSRDEYLALVARLILHVKDYNSQRRDKQALSQGIMGGPMPQQQMGTTGMSGQMSAIQDPINALQSMAMSGPGMGQPQSGMIGSGAQMSNLQQQQQQQQRQQQMINQLQQQRLASQQQQQQQQQQQPRPHLQRQDAFIVTASQPVQQISTSQQAQGQQVAQVTYSSGAFVPLVRQSLFDMTQMSPQVSSNPPSQGAVPSPAQQSSQQPVGSPVTMMASPSPHIVPSPGPRSNLMGAPSPSTVLNTPGNPGSVGTDQSPASQNTEELAYLEKLKSLYKYIEPLRRMIKKTEDGKSESSDQRKNDINKLKNLHDILTNPNKRVPMATLAKCETVLEKIMGPKISGLPSTAPPQPAPQVHMCQPLLDSVAAHITSPSFNHILHKTFGPAMSAIFGNPIRPPSPPPKRRKVEWDSKLPYILQGEIARLDRRFKVKLDPIQHTGSQDIHLVCRLDDQYLPSVPPMLVTVPFDYPDNSPECSTSRNDYESTPFLRAIQKSLVTHLLDLPSKFTFTALLDMWEISVRKACAPT